MPESSVSGLAILLDIIPGIIRQMPKTGKRGREKDRGEKREDRRNRLLGSEGRHLADSFVEGVIHVDRSVNWLASDSSLSIPFSSVLL